MILLRTSTSATVILLAIVSTHNVYPSASTQARKLLSYTIPEARELKKSLGWTEDAYFNFTELTSKYGYESQEHTIVTEDGYILTTFRILPKCKDNYKLYPVLLVHGLFDSSDMWIVPGTELGLGYILANNCYDVWAANLRGNVYSRRHMTLNPDTDIQYWDYSFDEHGNFDIPAIIDYILPLTGKSKVFYAGHSQGTTDFFAMASLRPDYNQKVQLSIQIAPVAWMTNSYSPIPRALAPNVKQIKQLLDEAGIREMFAKHHITHFLADILCHFIPEITCSAALTLSTGLESGSIERKVLSIAFGHLLSGASTKTLAHYGQLIVSKKFKRFDEGIKGNMRRYKKKEPPEYDVSQIVSPVVLICGRGDWLSSLKDIETLSSRLPNLVENYIVPIPQWSHLNHLWDKRANTYVIPKIIALFESYNH